MDPEVEQTELEQEVVPGSEAASESDGAEPQETQEEYFLRVNDRQAYKTQDEAIKAYDEAGKRIASYSRFGTPEEIEKLREDAQFARKMREALGDGNKPGPKKDPLEGVSPEEREQWQRFMGNFEKVAPNFGFVRAEEAQRLAREAVQQEMLVRQAVEEFRSALPEELEARGVKLTARGQAALERDITERINNPQEEFDHELRRLWIAGDRATLRTKALNEFYGEPAPQAEETAEEKAERLRDANGRFKAAQIQEVKERTSKLPKQPKKTAAPGAEPEDKSWQSDPAKRLERAKQMYEEMTGAAA